MITADTSGVNAAAVLTTSETTEGELRSRGASSSRNNPQSGDINDDDAAAGASCQRRGWLRMRASRLSILNKYKSRVFGAVVILILATIAVVISLEDVHIVSMIYIQYQ